MLKVVSEQKCLLGEGPVWDPGNQVICWIDILKGTIYELHPGTGFLKTIQTNRVLGAICLCENGDFLGAFQDGFGFIDRDTGAVHIVSDPEGHLPSNRFNDGKCDPSGRFWVGTMSLTEAPAAGTVYMLGRALSISRKIEGTTIANGMAWSPDGQFFYFIDSPTRRVVRYNYATSGEISEAKTVIEFMPGDGVPDGMTIDTEGMLWIAHWGGWQVSRWDPATGEKLLSIALPVAHVTSCVFGGEKLQDLYVTTARKGLSAEELDAQPLAGSLFVWEDSGYEGLPAVEYRK